MNKKFYIIKYFLPATYYISNKSQINLKKNNNSFLNKTVIIKNLNFHKNGQIGIIKKFEGQKFKIKLMNYNSIKSKKQIFINLHESNIEIL